VLAMIWAILAAIGVPLWLCAAGIATLVMRNRALRKRPDNIPVRMLRPGHKRWRPGHGIWVHDVFLFRGSPAAWNEAVLWAQDASARALSDDERGRLHRLGDEPLVATLTLSDGGTVQLAARGDRRTDLLGPFARSTSSPATGDAIIGIG
jgi:hypothetical protein